MADKLRKFVFIQNDPFYLPRVLDKYLREYHDSTVGINIQSVAQGRRSLFQTARDLLSIYGPRYFSWKLQRYLMLKIKGKVVNGLLGRKSPCYSVSAVARKYGVSIHDTHNVNSEGFRNRLRELKVDLIVSISGTQFYGKKLREQTPYGIINCHGALLPRYRGLMPSFWTLLNNEPEGGVSVHYVDGKIDNGPILVQRRYRINPWDTLEEIMARSKDLAAEAIIDAVRQIERGERQGSNNPETEATHFSMPTCADANRFRRTRHEFV